MDIHLYNLYLRIFFEDPFRIFDVRFLCWLFKLLALLYTDLVHKVVLKMIGIKVTCY